MDKKRCNSTHVEDDFLIQEFFLHLKFFSTCENLFWLLIFIVNFLNFLFLFFLKLIPLLNVSLLDKDIFLA